MAEVRALKNGTLDDRMSKFDHQDAYSKIEVLMAKARAGTVDAFAKYPESKDIQKPGYRHIVELIPKAPRDVFGRKIRLVRLYFAEPLVFEDKIVGLHVATKPNDHDPEDEQDAAIRVAGARADIWSKKNVELVS